MSKKLCLNCGRPRPESNLKFCSRQCCKEYLGYTIGYKVKAQEHKGKYYRPNYKKPEDDPMYNKLIAQFKGGKK